MCRAPVLCSSERELEPSPSLKSRNSRAFTPILKLSDPSSLCRARETNRTLRRRRYRFFGLGTQIVESFLPIGASARVAHLGGPSFASWLAWFDLCRIADPEGGKHL